MCVPEFLGYFSFLGPPPQGKNIHINPHFRPPPGGRGNPEGTVCGPSLPLKVSTVKLVIL